MMKKILLGILLMGSCEFTIAQQSHQENQFYSPFRFPTAVHSTEGSSIATSNVLQKIGPDILLMTYNLMGSYKFKRHGINAILMSDTDPLENEFYYKIGYSYVQPFNGGLQLYFGANFGVNQMYWRKHYRYYPDSQTPELVEYSQTSTFDFDIDLGVGVRYSNFLFEFAVNDIINMDVHPHYSQTTKFNIKTFYKMTFGNFNINPGLYSRFETYQFRAAPGYVTIQVELGYKNKYFIVPLYRTPNQFGLRTHHHFGEFSLFYGFIYGHTSNSKFNYIYNEFGLKYQFNKS